MTVLLGRLNMLKALSVHDSGMMLDGGDRGEILLPSRYVSSTLRSGDDIEVFISFDSNDRIVATTEKPFVMVGEFAVLDVVSVTKVGAFLDWGMPKDLFLPFREQSPERVKTGDKALVYVLVDTVSDRLVASMRISLFVDELASPYAKEGNKVELLIAAKTELGYKAIVDGTYWGLLYDNQVYRPMKRGERLNGYIQKLRADGKVDLSLLPSGYAKIDEIADKIFKMLQESDDSFLPFNDKSSPESIRETFNMSKKVFKQSIGGLYKQRLITIEEDGIKLV